MVAMAIAIIQKGALRIKAAKIIAISKYFS